MRECSKIVLEITCLRWSFEDNYDTAFSLLIEFWGVGGGGVLFRVIITIMRWCSVHIGHVVLQRSKWEFWFCRLFWTWLSIHTIILLQFLLQNGAWNFHIIKMGVMSRRVVPACGNLCFFCPSMRASSRQPVKRYKKILSEIFPRSQVNFWLCYLLWGNMIDF